MRKFLTRTLWLGVAGAAVLLAYRITGQLEFMPVVQFAAFPLVVATVLLVGVLVAVGLKNYALLSALLVAAFVIGMYPPPPVQTEYSIENPQHSLTVLSGNVMAGAATAELISAMRELSPDVVFIQECDARCDALISAPDIRAQWPHRIVESGASVEGSAILSVFELSESADVNGEFAMPAVVIQDSRLPQIFVQLAHPFPPLPTTTHVWKNELNALAERAAELTTERVIFAGDFNAGFEHAVFRELVTAGKFASAASASSTQGPTWRINGIEFLGTTLDHILIRGMESREFTIVELPSSDHKAIYAQLVF